VSRELSAFVGRERELAGDCVLFLWATALEAGMSQREVAKLLRVSHTQVRRDLELNVPENGRGRALWRSLRPNAAPVDF
jgi:hypothetical protein